MLVREAELPAALLLGPLEPVAERLDRAGELLTERRQPLFCLGAVHIVLLAQNVGVNAQDLSTRRADLHILDVREQDEWDAGHIAGSQHIPLGELGQRLAEVPTDRPIVAVCRSGSRSGAATRGLKQLGYDVENLDGGLTAWSRSGLPLVDRTERAGRVI